MASRSGSVRMVTMLATIVGVVVAVWLIEHHDNVRHKAPVAATPTKPALPPMMPPVAKSAYQRLPIDVPFGRNNARTMEVTVGGSDTIPIPRDLVLVWLVDDKTVPYQALSPLGSADCLDGTCKDLKENPESMSFVTKTGALKMTYWFEAK